MANEPETFLCLSGLAWTAISSIATALAVIVALLLPFYLNWRRRENLRILIEDEIDRNLEWIKMSDQMWGEDPSNGVKFRKVDLLCAGLVHLDTHIWEQNKQTIAEISSQKYLKYLDMEAEISKLKKYAIEIDESKGKNPVNLIEAMLENEIKPAIKKLEESVKHSISKKSRNQGTR